MSHVRSHRMADVHRGMWGSPVVTSELWVAAGGLQFPHQGWNPCIGSVECQPLGCGGLVAQSCPTALRPHGLQLARLLCPWGLSRPESCSGLPFPSSRGSSRRRDGTCISCLAGGFFTTAALSPWTTRVASSVVTSAAKDARCACRVPVVIILH